MQADLSYFFAPSPDSGPIRWSWVSLTGPDAVDYLQRLSTLNLKQIKPLQGQSGFLLTPQGKIRNYFYLWRLNETDIALEFDAGSQGAWKLGLLNTLEQFHFAEKFTLAEKSDLQALWLFPKNVGDVIQLDAFHTTKDSAGVQFFHHGTSDFGRAWLSAWGTAEQLEGLKKSAQVVDLENLHKCRIQASRPWIDSEITENTNPLELGLQESVAENKGCYPGQEVIEKIISLGSPARRLAKVAGEGAAPEVGSTLKVSGNDVGVITSAIESNGHFEALALVKKIHAHEGTEFRFVRGGAEHSAKAVFVAPYVSAS